MHCYYCSIRSVGHSFSVQSLVNLQEILCRPWGYPRPQKILCRSPMTSCRNKTIGSQSTKQSNERHNYMLKCVNYYWKQLLLNTMPIATRFQILSRSNAPNRHFLPSQRLRRGISHDHVVATLQAKNTIHIVVFVTFSNACI